MPFQDSEIIISLYDTLNGGPPRAFECKLCITRPKICRTIQGMLQHLLKFHDVKIQLELKDENEKQEPEPAESNS
jgi:hypothetical protein